jgi:hypothetical protein
MFTEDMHTTNFQSSDAVKMMTGPVIFVATLRSGAAKEYICKADNTLRRNPDGRVVLRNFSISEDAVSGGALFSETRGDARCDGRRGPHLIQTYGVDKHIDHYTI